MEKREPPKRVSTDQLREIGIDYIVHEMTRDQICEKYHLSRMGWGRICERMNLVERRLNYRKKLLDQALEKIAGKKNEIFVKAIEVMLCQINSISEWQRLQAAAPIDPNDKNGKIDHAMRKILKSDYINDVMKMVVLMANDAKTGGVGAEAGKITKVTVEMGSTSAVFTTPATAIDVESTPVEQSKIEEKPKEEPKPEPPKEEITVEVEDMGLGMPL